MKALGDSYLGESLGRGSLPPWVRSIHLLAVSKRPDLESGGRPMRTMFGARSAVWPTRRLIPALSVAACFSCYAENVTKYWRNPEKPTAMLRILGGRLFEAGRDQLVICQ